MLTGCSQISQADYNAIVAAKDKLQDDYDLLKEQTADWIQLSETEKAAQLANAEAERIKAEEAERKAQEEKAAEEAKRQAELEKQQVAEEAARFEEEKKGYDTGITYDQLVRTPDEYIGKKVKFEGTVLQVIEGDNEVNLRVVVAGDSIFYDYEDIILVYYSPPIVSSRVLEDDRITFYGTSEGLYTYASTLGENKTVPLVSVDQIDIWEFSFD